MTRPIYKKSLLNSATAILSVIAPAALSLIIASPSEANPTGGTVTKGSATITQTTPSTLTVQQTSQNAVINWQTFNIGNGETTQFAQPNSSAIALNRVTGGDPSQILGNLRGNGQVWLVNSSGVFFGPNAKVDVAGLLATTANISDVDFSAGNYVFNQTGTSAATVENQGTITVADTGLAALVAPNVVNSGTIQAHMGEIALASVNTFTVDLNGDGRFNFTVNSGSTPANTSAGLSDVGTSEISSGQASGILDGAINAEGLKQARSIGATSGTVSVSGTLDVSATNGNGGTIIASSQSINIASNGVLNASSDLSGSGGSIALIADKTSGTLDFYGTALARGGSQSGNGGFVETSGATVSFDGSIVDTSAAKGRTGTWLTDPLDLTVDSAAAATIAQNLSTTGVTLQTTATGATGPGTTASGAGDINIDAPITWSGGNTLTLDAYHGINILAQITVTGPSQVALITNDGGQGGDYSFGLTSTGFTGSLTYKGPGGGLTINGTSYTLINSMAQLASINAQNGAYALATSIDASGTTYSSPVVSTFSGIFTGLGHTISGLSLNTSSTYSGLFAQVGGTLRDIGLTSVSVDSTSAVQGTLVGLQTGGSVLNAFSIGSISDNYNVADNLANGSSGGLIGASDGDVYNSFSTVVITSNNIVGGLVGTLNSGGTVADSYATGSVTSAGIDVGGLVGELNGGGISTSFATGAAIGLYSVGGLVGFQHAGVIQNTYASGTVIATDTWAGGLVGSSDDTILSSYSYGKVSTIDTCTQDCAYYGAPGQTGGAVGFFNGGSVTNVYYDLSTSGQSGSQKGVGLTTAALQGGLPYGFDQSIWGTAPGVYPYLIGVGPMPNVGQTLDVIATSTSKTYGQADPATFGFSCTMNGAACPVDAAFSGTLTRDPGENVGTYDINQGSLTSAGFTIDFTAGIFTINPAVLTYVATAVSRTYGQTNPALTGTVIGFVNGDTQASATTGTLTFTTTADQNSDVNSYAIAGSGLSAQNYTFAQAAGNSTALTITQAVISAILIPKDGPVEKQYDTTTNATVPTDDVQLIGVLPQDENAVSVASIGSATYSDQNAGTSKIVTAYGIVLGGSKKLDYSLSTPATGSIGIITPASLSISALPCSKQYDGNNICSSLSPGLAVVGLISPDQVQTETELFNSIGPGKEIDTYISSIVINDGNGGHNYSYNLANSTCPGCGTIYVTLSPSLVSQLSGGPAFPPAIPSSKPTKGTDTTLPQLTLAAAAAIAKQMDNAFGEVIGGLDNIQTLISGLDQSSIDLNALPPVTTFTGLYAQAGTLYSTVNTWDSQFSPPQLVDLNQLPNAPLDSADQQKVLGYYNNLVSLSSAYADIQGKLNEIIVDSDSISQYCDEVSRNIENEMKSGSVKSESLSIVLVDLTNISQVANSASSNASELQTKMGKLSTTLNSEISGLATYLFNQGISVY